MIFEGNLKSIRQEEMRDCRNGFKSGTIKPLFAIWEAPKEGKYVVEAWAAKGIFHSQFSSFYLIFTIIVRIFLFCIICTLIVLLIEFIRRQSGGNFYL